MLNFYCRICVHKKVKEILIPGISCTVVHKSCRRKLNIWSCVCRTLLLLKMGLSYCCLLWWMKSLVVCALHPPLSQGGRMSSGRWSVGTSRRITRYSSSRSEKPSTCSDTRCRIDTRRYDDCNTAQQIQSLLGRIHAILLFFHVGSCNTPPYSSLPFSLPSPPSLPTHLPPSLPACLPPSLCPLPSLPHTGIRSPDTTRYIRTRKHEAAAYFREQATSKTDQSWVQAEIGRAQESNESQKDSSRKVHAKEGTVMAPLLPTGDYAGHVLRNSRVWS